MWTSFFFTGSQAEAEIWGSALKIHIVDFTGHDAAVRQVVANISEERGGPLSGSVFVWTTQNHAPEQHEIKLLFLYEMLWVSVEWKLQS